MHLNEAISRFLLSPKCQIQQFNLDINSASQIRLRNFQVEMKISLTGNNGFESDFKERKALPVTTEIQSDLPLLTLPQRGF